MRHYAGVLLLLGKWYLFLKMGRLAMFSRGRIDKLGGVRAFAIDVPEFAPAYFR